MPQHNGLGLFWKPRGPSSGDFIGGLKKALAYPTSAPRKDVGHSGTLDPFAEGLLCVGFYEGLKLLPALVGMDKEYIATFCFSHSSPTLDNTAEPFENGAPLRELTNEEWGIFLKKHSGDFEQRAPAFSAKRIKGQRLHERARSFEGLECEELMAELEALETELEPHTASILEAQYLGSMEQKLLDDTERTAGSVSPKIVAHRIRLKVAAGTYIRSLARDWGRELFGKPGLVLSLQRVGIGPWSFKESFESAYWLKVNDLGRFFKCALLESEQEQHALKQHGQLLGSERFKGELRQPTLLLSAGSREPLAWLPRDFQGKLGRVFASDPLAHP